jgi:enoyl-CoA hydratase
MFEIKMAGAAKNALGTEMLRFLLDRLKVAAVGRQPVLLSGAGDAFSAGLNLKEVATLTGDAMLDFLRLLEECMVSFYLHPAPVVAAINGHAIAGGCVLALCCDWRVAAPNPTAKIGLNEVALGIRFPPRILALVRRRLPPQHLEEVLLGAGLFAPERALALGLVDEIAEDAEGVARARLSALAAHHALGDAYALTKQDLRGTPQDLCPDEVYERRLRESLALWDAPVLRERIAAVLKR